MVKIVISSGLKVQIKKVFSKTEGYKIADLFETLHQNPRKGKVLTQISGIVIKELKYKTFRFYFLTDGHVLKLGTESELADLIIKFVRMSKKKDQQQVIEQLKDVLKSLGFEKL